MRKTSKLWFMFVNCSYIVSFVVKSPSGGKNPWKTAPANLRRSLFENCFKFWFDTVRWWGMSCAFDFLRNYWFRCFLRRVMVIFRQQKNFGPNVIYFVLRVDSWVSLPPHSSWRLQLRLRLFTAFVVNFFAAVTLYADVYKLSILKHLHHRSFMFFVVFSGRREGRSPLNC